MPDNFRQNFVVIIKEDRNDEHRNDVYTTPEWALSNVRSTADLVMDYRPNVVFNTDTSSSVLGINVILTLFSDHGPPKSYSEQDLIAYLTKRKAEAQE